MSAIATSAPWRARSSAIARPNPRAPPVISAVLPVRSFMLVSALSWMRVGRPHLAPEVAGDLVLRLDLLELGLLLPRPRLCEGAACVEPTSGRRVPRARDLALAAGSARRSRAGVDPAPGTAERSARVYGWAGRSKIASARADLDDTAEVHDCDPVRHVAERVEVVGDDQVREPELATQVLHQIEDARRGRDVEAGRRLVGDDEARPQRERTGDADSPSLSARQLVRDSGRPAPREADHLQQLRHGVASVRSACC